ncbi:uncharacterized protein LOC132270764, partial [Cornus florida]|uniref:uncharacterized protein LOC132270764 n=1 Tax=Cornus florida TaxID=4283 RepID=UPI00289C7F9F
MGCGKSKPAVATGNTISRSKRSSNTDHAKKTKDIETIPEKTTNNTNTNTDTNTQVETKNAKVEEDSNSSIQPKQEIENAEKGSEIGNIIVKVVADKEDVKLNADSKEGDGNEEKDKKKQGELISGGADSPESSFFSTRGDGETIEAV